MTTRNGSAVKEPVTVRRKSRAHAMAVLVLLFVDACRKLPPPAGDLKFQLEQRDPATASALAMSNGTASAQGTTLTTASISSGEIAKTSTADEFPINIGDTVSPDHPASGAGKVLRATQPQSYLFSADAGAIVYVKASRCEGGRITLELRNAANQAIGGNSSCNDFGPVTLARAGKYRIVVRADRDGTRYGFSLLRTTFETFPIKVGDTVSPDRPSRSAGVIGKLGERQAYPFQAAAGSIVYVKVGPCAGSPITFDLQNPANQVIAGIGGCGSFGPITLASAGMYRVLVSADRVAGVRYSFSVLPARLD